MSLLCRMENSGKVLTSEQLGLSSGWKAIVLLQFQPQFQIVIYFGILVAYVAIMIDFAHAMILQGVRTNFHYRNLASAIYIFDIFYFLDLLLMTIYKNIKWSEVKHMYPTRHGIILLCEYISLFPIERLFHIQNVNFFYFRMRYVYRMVRIILLTRKKNKIYDDKEATRVFFKLFVIFSIISVSAACVVIPIVCIAEHISFFNTTEFYMLFYTTTGRLTSKGFGQLDDSPDALIFEYLLLASMTVVAFVLTSTYISIISCLLIPKVKYKFLFAHNFMHVFQNLDEWKMQNVTQWKNYHRSFYNTVIKFLRVIWKNIQDKTCKEIQSDKIPQVLSRDIALDMSWNAFKHSHLFRDQHTFFLRYVCTKMKHENFLPGEIVYKKNENKSTMIYIVSGIMQVISEENSETPILSLSGGTCIGESTLVIDYPTNYTVISKTYCEVILLKRKHFITIVRDHPEVYRNLVKIIRDRYEQAFRYFELRNYKLKKCQHMCTSESLSLYYIKNVMNALLKDDYVTEKNQKYYQIRRSLREHVFCPYYLDLLTITEEIELISDSVFVKRKFPFVFQPHSIVLKWWDVIVSIASAIFIAGYPVALCTAYTVKGKQVAMTCILAISILWVLDIYIKISTAVKTRDTFLTKFSDIIYYRLSTFDFIIDLFCVLPFGLFLNIINNNISANMMLLLETHKLLKIYRISNLFNKVSELNSNRMLLIMYVRSFLVIFILIYYSACVLYMLICDKKCSERYIREIQRYYNINENDVLRRFIQILTISSFFINDTTIYSYMELLQGHQFLVIIFMQIAYCCIYIYLLSGAIAMDTVNQQEKHEFKEFASTMSMMMKKFNFESGLEKRIWRYLKDQYYNDMGMSFLNPQKISKIMSKNLYTLYTYVMYGRFIASSTIFSNTDDDLIMDVAKRVRVHIYSEGETITCAGEICKEIHIIVSGYCQMINRQGVTRLLRPKDTFSVVDLCLNIPTVNTVITCTDCKIISLTTQDYLQITSTHQGFRGEMDYAIRNCDVHISLYQMDNSVMFTEIFQIHKHKRYSFHHFRYTKKKSENLTFHTGFGKYTQFFKYILLRHTITPYGNFMFWYEASRCIFAFTTNLLTSFINITEMNMLQHILVSLDITAWIDIYVMHHVCYFNEAGLEISHPMYTAIYYWKHAFLIDVLGSFPIDYIINIRTWMIIYLRLNRLLQLRRIFGFFSHLNANNISRTGTLDILKYLPLTILIINYMAFLLLYSTCDVGVVRKDEDECASRFMVNKRMKNTTFTHINAQGASLLLVTGTLSMIGITKLRLRRIAEMIYLTALVLVGVIFSIWLTAKMVANNFYRNTDLTSYQQAMRDLINFFNYRKIDKNIKKEIIEHYEHMWQKKKGKNLHHLLSCFNTCFKEDLLFGIFGKYLVSSPIFLNAERAFLKSLLLEMDYAVYLKRAIIYRVNDIHGKIFFLLSGEIDVLGPDYNKLVTLTSGSLFGSLDNYVCTRQTLMMVAKGNVEILEISSISFHYILSKYTALYKHFRRLTAINVDYIESCLKIVKNSLSLDEESKTKSYKLYNFYIKMNPLHVENIYTHIWHIFLLICVDFVGFHLELFQKVTLTTGIIVMCGLYLFDVLNLAKIYLRFHTCYQDEYGMTVRDRRKIAFKYINNKTKFYIDIISTIPFEIMCLFLTDKSRFITFSCCRINRLLRIVSVCIALKNTREKLYVNVIAMRMLLIFTWLTIYIHLNTVLYVYVRSLLRVYRPDYYDRLSLYATSVYIVAYTSLGSAVNYFNITYDYYIILYTVLITTIGRFIVALFIAETCATIESVNKSKNVYKQFAVAVRNFIKRKDVSPPLTKEVSEYVQMLWVHHRGVHVPDLLEKAPYYLKEATWNAMFGYHLRQHYILKNCHIDLLRQMVAEMRLLVFFPGNHIIYKGDIDHCMYFIHEGVVDALSKDSLEMEVVEKTLSSGDSFGLIQGLHARKGHDYTYKARKHSIVNVLERDKWFHMLNFFPASKAIVDECLLADQNGQFFN